MFCSLVNLELVLGTLTCKLTFSTGIRCLFQGFKKKTIDRQRCCVGRYCPNHLRAPKADNQDWGCRWHTSSTLLNTIMLAHYYVFDIESSDFSAQSTPANTDRDLQIYAAVIEALAEFSLRAPIFVMIDKMDGDTREPPLAWRGRARANAIVWLLRQSEEDNHALYHFKTKCSLPGEVSHWTQGWIIATGYSTVDKLENTPFLLVLILESICGPFIWMIKLSTSLLCHRLFGRNKRFHYIVWGGPRRQGLHGDRSAT